jgi:hypothetical protein
MPKNPLEKSRFYELPANAFSLSESYLKEYHFSLEFHEKG